MAPLDHSSGKLRGSKSPKHVNTRAKAAMMNALDRHRKEVLQSQRYYETKRAAGKTHNQAIRALGRHLCRVIFKMLRNDRPYWIDSRRDPADTPIKASDASQKPIGRTARQEADRQGEIITARGHRLSSLYRRTSITSHHRSSNTPAGGYCEAQYRHENPQERRSFPLQISGGMFKVGI